MLSFASGSAIKRIKAGVKAAADRLLPGSDPRRAFTLPTYPFQTKEEYCVLSLTANPTTLKLLAAIKPYLGRFGPVALTGPWRVYQYRSAR